MSEPESSYFIFSDADHAKDLVFQQDTVLTDTISASNTMQVQADTVPPPPSFTQIRYWRWLREQKLLIGDSRYIQPQNTINLVPNLKVEPGGLGLPVQKKSEMNTDWLTIVLVAAMVLIATVRFSYSKYVSNLFQSLLNSSTAFRMFREKNYTILHGAFRLDLLFYIIFSVFVYQVIGFFQLELIYNKLAFFASIFGLVFAYFFLKKMIYRLLGLIFERGSETNEYLFIVDNFNRTLGIILFPVVALINYYPADRPVYMVVTGLIVVGVFYLFLLQRGFLILLKKHFSIFYLFLYLCTLEILPLLLIYKGVVL